MEFIQTVHIGNIPYELLADELHQLLHSFGPVSVTLLPDPTSVKPHRGFAHVTFHGDAAANHCISQLNGFIVYGRPLRVERSRTGSGGTGAIPRGGGPVHVYGTHNVIDHAFAARTSVPVMPHFESRPALPQAPPPTTISSVRSVVESMSAAEQYDILATLRTMCDTPGGRDNAEELLSSCPSFAHAVLMMEERLGMLQVGDCLF